MRSVALGLPYQPFVLIWICMYINVSVYRNTHIYSNQDEGLIRQPKSDRAHWILCTAMQHMCVQICLFVPCLIHMFAMTHPGVWIQILQLHMFFHVALSVTSRDAVLRCVAVCCGVLQCVTAHVLSHCSICHEWDSFVCVPWLIRMRAMTLWYVCHASFACVNGNAARSNSLCCRMTHSHVWRAWWKRVRGSAHSRVRHDWHVTFTCAMAQLYVCHAPHRCKLHVCHDSLTRVTWLVQSEEVRSVELPYLLWGDYD